jgi:formate-dependent phosphoribosylglycinamide formyltransferase (GAR transformylase)
VEAVGMPLRSQTLIILGKGQSTKNRSCKKAWNYAVEGSVVMLLIIVEAFVKFNSEIINREQNNNPTLFCALLVIVRRGLSRKLAASFNFRQRFIRKHGEKSY